MLDEYARAGEPYVYNDEALARADFAAFVARSGTPGTGLEETYLLADPAGELIGEFRLRPHVAEPYERHYGHVGYNIRPSRRRQGHGRRGLLLLRDLARDRGLPGLSLLISPDNGPSRSLAGSAGAKLIAIDRRLPEGPTVELWWLSTGAP
jgi:predicted acetyltransferase